MVDPPPFGALSESAKYLEKSGVHNTNNFASVCTETQTHILRYMCIYSNCNLRCAYEERARQVEKARRAATKLSPPGGGDFNLKTEDYVGLKLHRL